jgi:integrase/recombinase XerD
MQTYIDAYRKELLNINNFAPDTVKNYLSCLSQYFEFARDHLKIEPLQTKSKHLKKWMASLKAQGMCRSRLIHHQSAIKRFFAVLIKLNVLKRNPAQALFHIKKPKSELNQPINQQTAVQLLRAIERNTWLDERNFIIISLLWALGLRISELTSLKVNSFEPEHDPGNRIGLLRVRGKGNKERALFVVDKLYDRMITYLAHPESPKDIDKPMFPTTLKNKAVSPDRIQRMMKQLLQKAGITERITPHVLRHTFATDMYTQNIPIDAIEVMLGHTTTDETSIYIHVPEIMKKQALETITIQGRKQCH